MSGPIEFLPVTLNVLKLKTQLAENKILWNQYTDRTANPESPHHEVDDIWVRFAAPEFIKTKDPYESVWYPCAETLSEVKPIVFTLMNFVQGEQLGGVLITKIKPGKKVTPHVDAGWHAGFYKKFAIQIASTPGQAFCFEEKKLSALPGEVYFFDNSKIHWVENNTAHERITLIVCIKTSKEF